MRRVVLACVLTACGRIGFDPSHLGTTGGSLGCPRAPSIPDPIAIGGMTFTYANFQNKYDVQPAIPVAALAPSGDMIASTTSDAGGNYSLSVPSGGDPVDVVLTYSVGDTSFLATTIYSDQPLDHDAPGSPDMTPFQLGDGSMWSDASMAAVYGTTTRTAGTISIITHTCDDQLVDGVAIAIDPAPELVMYSDAGGFPSQTLTATTAPDDAAIGFNAPAGHTRVTATKPGFVTTSADIVIGGMETSTLLLLHVQPEMP